MGRIPTSGIRRDCLSNLEKKALSDLLQSSSDIEAYLDFPLSVRLSDKIVNQNDHLPRELIILAGELRLGIEMAQYSRDSFEDLEDSSTENKQAESGRRRVLTPAPHTTGHTDP